MLPDMKSTLTTHIFRPFALIFVVAPAGARQAAAPAGSAAPAVQKSASAAAADAVPVLKVTTHLVTGRRGRNRPPRTHCAGFDGQRFSSVGTGHGEEIPDSSDWHGEFHKISVKSTHPGMQLSFRQGYYAHAGSPPVSTGEKAGMIRSCRSCVRRFADIDLGARTG
jgi:hypothetical protein